MIQAVSEVSAFHIGHQYVTESRVRIIEADDSQISSAVIGNSGLYEQTIRLKDGQLISKCTCTLSEEPMCRHCIAVLLEYHRWAQPRQSRKVNATRGSHTQVDPEPNTRAFAEQSSSPDVKLNEIMLFVEWLGPAMKAIETGIPVPDPPTLSPGEVSKWIEAIRNLEDRRRQSEEVQMGLEAEMRDREAYVERLTQQLQTSILEVKTAQAGTQEVQREVAEYKGILTKVGELAGEVLRYDGQMRSMASEILSQGTQLNKLTTSFKELAEALKSAAKQRPTS